MFLAIFALALPAAGADRVLRLATTTSTENSGLLRVLVPRFEAASGLKVQVISVGTGKAMKLGENGDVDVMLVHSRPDEDRFVAQGFGVHRQDVMYNDFVVVGPKADPARIAGLRDVLAAFRRILEAKAVFVSRGDDSGTDKMEKGYWGEVGRRPEGRQYLAAGQGMGEVLTMADNLGGYTLSDRATYGAYRARIALDLLVEGDRRLFNPYGVIAVNPARYKEVNYRGAKQFIEWLTGAEGRKSIADFRINGEQLFFPTPR
ncbi:MAG: substrate-binding domain-containing protein [Pseudomonadota bacterium]|nr:substrate-binding domain-containing protein [Pseudomonadota bacterium]